MLELNKEKGIVMHSGDFFHIDTLLKLLVVQGETKRSDILFFGTKSELLQKDEEFWKGICEMGYSVSPALIRATESKRPAWRDYTVQGFQSLKGSKRLPYKTAKESGQSAVSLIKEEFILIVKENKVKKEFMKK